MSWQSLRSDRISELEGLLRNAEASLARLNRAAARTSTPAVVDRIGDMMAAALGEIAERFRGGSRAASREASAFGREASAFGREASALGDDALKLGNDALRRVAHEIEQRPLVTLAVAVGVGVIAAGLFARRD